jgi:hypothetical protein
MFRRDRQSSVEGYTGITEVKSVLNKVDRQKVGGNEVHCDFLAQRMVWPGKWQCFL